MTELIRVSRITALALCMLALQRLLHSNQADISEEDAAALRALGLALAESVQLFRLSEAELELVKLGLADGVMGRAQRRYGEYSAKVTALAKQRIDRTFREQEEVGAAFRARILAETPNAQLTESDAIVIVVREGSGARPGEHSLVRVAYEGSLVDGTVFDSTRNRDPITVVLRDARMPCLREGLQRMRAGTRARMICHPVRGFSHPYIPAGSTLVYDIELLEVLEPSSSGLR